MIEIQKAGYHGLYFPKSGVVLDGHHPNADYTFVSHAHADHMPRNRSAVARASAPTIELMKKRGFKGKTIAMNFHEPFEAGRCKVTLYPAGHILGSAMIYIESDAGSVLYTGDYRIPPSPASEGFDSPGKTDILITEATFSLPVYRWKPLDELAHDIQNFAINSLDDGYTPVFLGYSLGKAQEIMHMLAPLGLPIQVHDAGYQLCEVYDKYGIDLGNYSAYSHETCEGKILVCPPSALSNGFASGVSKKRVAYCSGWAADESRRTQLAADTFIPLSDHLDFFELIDFCKKLSPRKTYITHTPNPDVVIHYLENEHLNAELLDLNQ